jgi:hypothetical protein
MLLRLLPVPQVSKAQTKGGKNGIERSREERLKAGSKRRSGQPAGMMPRSG